MDALRDLAIGLLMTGRPIRLGTGWQEFTALLVDGLESGNLASALVILYSVECG
jgi:hypothetical protein